MKLPDNLEKLIEEEVNKYKLSELKEYSEKLSNKYMSEKRTGKTLLSQKEEAVTYSVIRMPATFGAIYNALNQALENKNIEIKSLLDIGAGTGAASFAVSELIDIKQITCLEREKVMMQLGKKLMSQGNYSLKNAKWIDNDIIKDGLNEKADLVIVSYMINELKEEDRLIILDKLLESTNKILLIVEPGTPEGFKNIKKIREEVINKKLNILAPCTHKKKCPLSDDDWCSSVVRVQRTKIHKILKDGDVPFEDEKFSYIAISKQEYNNARARILRHPIIQNKMIKLKLCTESGIQELTITKKNSDIYKKIKKKKVGDSINLN